MSFVVYKDERDNYHYIDEDEYNNITKYLEAKQYFGKIVEIETNSGNRYEGKFGREYDNDTFKVIGDDKVMHLIPIWSVKTIKFFRKDKQ